MSWRCDPPGACGRYTATAAHDRVLDVQLGDDPLPEVGHAEQGMHMTPTERDTGNGDSRTPTFHIAAMQVGRDAFTFTCGGLDDVPNDAGQAAVRLGVQRLAEVRKQGWVPA